jgi:uncharacterized membrane protein
VNHLHIRPHEHVRHPFADFDAALASRVNRWFGSMVTFWVLVAWQLGWMLLATLGVLFFRSDAYPFVFLLFLSNLIQLWALPILGSTTNEADRKRDLAASAQHEALTYLANRVDAIHAALDAAGETKL